MNLTFDEASHVYCIDGVIVPSVTGIIGHILPGWKAGDWYLQRGRAVHHGCRLLDEGRLDWATVAPEIEPRIRAWDAFVTAAKLSREGMVAERPLGSERSKFAGTVDRVFATDKGDLIVDIKSTIEPQVRIQLGGYSLLWRESTGRQATRGAAVEVREDGTFSTLNLNVFDLRRAEQQFLACLTIYNFKTLYNIGANHG